MLRSLFSFFLSLFSFIAFAGKITGKVTDDKGIPLAYASISIKGSAKGTNANGSGNYSITLSPGQYTLICQFVNYKKEEKTITVTAGDQVVDFNLSIQQLTLSEVIVKKGEDPAYGIIRQAIKKRSYYNNQVDSFSVDVYIKGCCVPGECRKRYSVKRLSGMMMMDWIRWARGYYFFQSLLPKYHLKNLIR
ncbi:MAG: carboxypeptidase-like regulatory domain-containing protein [Bacteroidota bacterium]